MATLASVPGVASAGAIDDWVKSMTRIVQGVNRVNIIGTELSVGNDLVPEEFVQNLDREIDQLHKKRYSEFEGSEDDYAMTVHAWVKAGVTDELDRAIARAKRRIAEERVLGERIKQLEERIEHASESILVARKLETALEEIVSGPGAAIDALIARRLSFTLLRLDEEVILKLSARNSELRRVYREAKERLEALAAHNEEVRPQVEILKEERERRQAQNARHSTTGASGRLTQATTKNVIAKMHADKGLGRGSTQGGALTQGTVRRPDSPPLRILIDPIPDAMRVPFKREDASNLSLPYTNPFTTPWHGLPRVMPDQDPISIENLQ